jgi:Type II secretory pathway, ATPase PulE/Tfp pilus assembly pathway, ATPase PilB
MSKRLSSPEQNQWELRKVAKERGVRTMVEDGMLKVKEGKTTVGEVLRVTSTLMEGE